MDGEKCCQNCRHHLFAFDIPGYREAEFPYVACTMSGNIVPKWNDCEEWEDEHEAHHGQQSEVQ